MKLISSNPEKLYTFLKEWSEADRLELHTCRPVINGRRIPRSNEVFHFLYFEESIFEPVGNIFYFDINERNLSCEFGYKINPKYRNQGFGKTMLAESIYHIFTNTNFNKLYCQTASFNLPSVKLLESIGFKRDGILREHHELEGILYDDYIYSMLRSDWRL